MKTTFTTDQKKELKKHGYLVYKLSGQTIKTLRKDGLKFWTDWHEGEPIDDVASMECEVAFNPDKLFLKDSESKTFDEHKALVEALKPIIKGTKNIIGNVADYLELTHLHFKKTGLGLFGTKYNYNYTRTITEVGSRVADVGYFDGHDGIDVNARLPQVGLPGLRVAPLVCLDSFNLGIDTSDSVDLKSDKKPMIQELAEDYVKEAEDTEIERQLTKAEKMLHIVTWLYTNDRQYDSKNEWRKAVIKKLEEIL